MIAGAVWLIAVLVNILVPTGLTSPKGALFKYDWMTLLVVAAIIVLGAIVSLVLRPAKRMPVGPEVTTAAALRRCFQPGSG